MLTKLFGILCQVGAITFAFLAGGGVVQVSHGIIDIDHNVILWEILTVFVLSTLSILCLWSTTKVIVVPQDREE